eukprot:1189046-Prorocentrum_minimum.AAC.2
MKNKLRRGRERRASTESDNALCRASAGFCSSDEASRFVLVTIVSLIIVFFDIFRHSCTVPWTGQSSPSLRWCFYPHERTSEATSIGSGVAVYAHRQNAASSYQNFARSDGLGFVTGGVPNTSLTTRRFTFAFAFSLRIDETSEQDKAVRHFDCPRLISQDAS